MFSNFNWLMVSCLNISSFIKSIASFNLSTKEIGIVLAHVHVSLLVERQFASTHKFNQINSHLVTTKWIKHSRNLQLQNEQNFLFPELCFRPWAFSWVLGWVAFLLNSCIRVMIYYSKLNSIFERNYWCEELKNLQFKVAHQQFSKLGAFFSSSYDCFILVRWR